MSVNDLDETGATKLKLSGALSQSGDSIKCVAGTAQNVSDLVSNQFFDSRSSWSKVLARIELFGCFPKCFSKRCRHGEPEIRVDVNFGAAESTGDFDVRFRHSCCVFSE